jgi:hypothetical protein
MSASFRYFNPSNDFVSCDPACFSSRRPPRVYIRYRRKLENAKDRIAAVGKARLRAISPSIKFLRFPGSSSNISSLDGFDFSLPPDVVVYADRALVDLESVLKFGLSPEKRRFGRISEQKSLPMAYFQNTLLG